jgi:hypothetical protein
MATKPKRREQDLTADAKHVAATVRFHLDAFEEADAVRKKKFLGRGRLEAFERSIQRFEKAAGWRETMRAAAMGATDVEGARRGALRERLRELRAEVRLGYPADRSLGRAFGMGLPLGRKSTPEVLAVARGVLAAWENPVFREAALDIGITAARIEEVRELTRALGDAGTEHALVFGKGLGQTIGRQRLLRGLCAETAYLRRVAQLVFRKRPEVLAEFASPLPRRTVRARRSVVLAAEEAQGTAASAARAEETRVRTGAPPNSEAETTPSVADRVPSRGEMTPSLAETMPSFAERTPSFMEGSPSRAETSPSRAKKAPSRAKRGPARAARSQGRAKEADVQGHAVKRRVSGAEGAGTVAQVRGKRSRLRARKVRMGSASRPVMVLTDEVVVAASPRDL